MAEIRPLITESSTSESTTVEVVMNDLRDNLIQIPDYQRDSDQWSETTKSLLVESVINNLSIPAFFLEVIVEGGVEKNEVIDGQQRLTTLFDFFENRLRLVDSQEAPYLSPNSIHYAGKIFGQLPEPYRQAFKKYRLAVIKLRNLGGMRLEIFRRINQGGTPLSGQDIRLAYYGEKSPSLAFIRLTGIYDQERQAARRFLNNADAGYGLKFPWADRFGLEAWNDWWNEKEIAHGQTASETFLWSLVVAQVQALDAILQNTSALQTLRTRFNGGIDEALDVYCAQLRWQDANPESPAAVHSFTQMRDEYFPFFQDMIKHLLGQKGPSLPVYKHRTVASVIGAAFRAKTNLKSLSEQQWTNLVELIRHPPEISRRLGIDWPQSKGRWDGPKGYRAQMEAAQSVVAKIADAR
jgi:Protein of unknown function DUF262